MEAVTRQGLLNLLEANARGLYPPPPPPPPSDPVERDPEKAREWFLSQGMHVV